MSDLLNMTDHQFSDIEMAANPIISPDGAYIVYRLNTVPDLYVMNSDGSNKKI
jgi:hypothetical protein